MSKLHPVWFPVAETPPQKTLLMVTGPSGYNTHKKFLTLAYLDDEFRPPLPSHPMRWQSVTNDSLTDEGWEPTHWAWPVELP